MIWCQRNWSEFIVLVGNNAVDSFVDHAVVEALLLGFPFGRALIEHNFRLRVGMLI